MERSCENVTQPVPAVERREQRANVVGLRFAGADSAGHRRHSRDGLCHILFAALAFFAVLVMPTRATEPDTFSPVVSYQFYDSLDDSPATSPIVSPVVSYQYYDWIGDENVTFQNSASVSYYFSGGVALAVSGTVRTTAGLPVGGAAISLKRYGTAFWSGTSATDGTFSMSNLQAAGFTLVAAKPGYLTKVSSHDGTAGGSQAVAVTLEPLPAAPLTHNTSRVATTNETTPPVPTGADIPVLKVFNGTAFVAGGTIYTDRMTIVMAHGMNSNLSEWAVQLAGAIRTHHALGSQTPNIIAWDWHFPAIGKGPNHLIPPVDNAATQGAILGQVLLQTVGPGYSKRLHFIGHSLGAIVNCVACDYLHGSLARSTSNPLSHCDPLLTNPHVTLLDEAEIATIAGSNVTTAAAVGWKVAQLKGALLAGGAAAAADWKNTIPKNAKWVDNYISLVGLQRDGAVNVCLLAPTVSFDWLSPYNSLVSAHSYAHLYYRNTVSPSGPAPAVGYGKSYESALTFPPSGTGLSAGSVWLENLATPDILDLVQDTNPVPFGSNLTILTALMVQPAAGLAKIGDTVITQPLDTVGRGVLSGYEAGIEWAGDIGGTVIYKTPQVYAATKEKLGTWWDAAQDAASNVLNSIDPEALLAGPVSASVFSITLSSQGAPLAPLQAGKSRIAATSLAPQPASAWLTVNVPANAGMIAFDFKVTGDPVDDSIACAVNGQNIFALPAKFAPDGSPVSTDMMDISAYAGQTIELFFGLVGGTSTNCQVEIDGIRFITIPTPKVGIVANGANVAVKWPAAATGWVLEATDSLSPPNWQPVPMTGATVASGVATVEQPMSGAKKFFRLRRLP